MALTSDRLVQESLIKSLLIRERYYRDTCQWDNFRDSYHPDSSKTHIEITWFQGDIDGFVSGSMEMAKGGTGSVHTICPVELHINGNRAVSESIGSISIRFSYNGLLYDCVSINRFISRLECVDGKWKLLTLEAIYDRDSIIPTLPSFQPGELPVPKGGRESYKCITWVLSQKGFKIKQDLPGVDEPHRYIGLMKEHLEWLF